MNSHAAPSSDRWVWFLTVSFALFIFALLRLRIVGQCLENVVRIELSMFKRIAAPFRQRTLQVGRPLPLSPAMMVIVLGLHRRRVVLLGLT
jgi:hypothetical protein